MEQVLSLTNSYHQSLEDKMVFIIVMGGIGHGVSVMMMNLIHANGTLNLIQIVR